MATIDLEKEQRDISNNSVGTMNDSLSGTSLRADLPAMCDSYSSEIPSTEDFFVGRNHDSPRSRQDREMPLSAFDYRAYRHKLMEEVLMKYYDERMPPGEVVMNSILLNAVDDNKWHVGSRLALTN